MPVCSQISNHKSKLHELYVTRVGILPLQKVFLPGQWKKGKRFFFHGKTALAKTCQHCMLLVVMAQSFCADNAM